MSVGGGARAESLSEMTWGLCRRAGLYVLALWGREFVVRSAHQDSIPRLQGETIHLPVSWKSHGRAALLHRAAACHAAAHGLYGRAAFEAGDLSLRQRELVGLMEDARVEALAMARFPGLRRLWKGFHATGEAGDLRFPALVRRLACALLEESLNDPNHWVRKGVRSFYGQRQRWEDPWLAREIGLELARDLGQMRIVMNEGERLHWVDYRDDNHHLWTQEETVLQEGVAGAPEVESTQAPKAALLRETGQGDVLGLAEAHGPESESRDWLLRNVDAEEAVLEYRRVPQIREAPAQTYGEWDYRIQLVRARWCKVYERPADEGSADWVDPALRRYRHAVLRLQRIIRAVRLENLKRVRRQPDGDELDLDAAINALVSLHNGEAPDMRLHSRARPLHECGLASLVLLDLSESANDPLSNAGQTLLELTREAALVLGQALQTLGEPFGIHGFCSRGRHAVNYTRFKDFEDAFDAAVMARLAGMEGRYSTRLGAGLRHATRQLAERTEPRKSLIVLTDGVPSDIDVFDSEYLGHDARYAVHEALRAGVQVFCLNVGSSGRSRMLRMFGARRFRSLRRVDHMPDLLPEILMMLMRRR